MSSDNLKVHDLQWRKAIRSAGNGECVEVAPAQGRVVVRDSKNPEGYVLKYSAQAWWLFLAECKSSRAVVSK